MFCELFSQQLSALAYYFVRILRFPPIEEIAEELGTTTEELNYLKESLFKNLFESASENIKNMLTIQYRMHPQIMAGINQFYEDNLECGLTNP
jgi:superfamily I DNA and/or RNA helicase